MMRAAVAVLVLACGTAACDAPRDRTTASATAAPRAEESAAPPRPASTFTLPTDGDPSITEELHAVSRCPPVKEDVDRCLLTGAFLTFTSRHVEEASDPAAARVAAAHACLALIQHVNAYVRYAAYACIAEHRAAVRDPRNAIGAVLHARKHEPNRDVRWVLGRALAALDPTKHGLAHEVLPLARGDATAGPGGTARAWQLGDVDIALLPALAPRDPTVEPIVGSVDLALTILSPERRRDEGAERARLHASEVIAILGHARSQGPRVCPALISAFRDREPSAELAVLRALETLDGTCSAWYDELVTLLLADAARAQVGYECWHCHDMLALLRKPGFTPAQRERLRAGLSAEKARRNARPDGHGGPDCGYPAILEELKKR